MKHFLRWNKWRKYNQNSAFYKLLVLFKITKSPTLEIVEELEEMEMYL